jgi:nitroreductase
MNVLEAIRERRATRAFLDKPVSREQIETILDTARWAPSGVNTQPWKVAVVEGRTKQALTERLIAARDEGLEPDADYQYYPTEWIDPYRRRRIDCGKALYGALGIAREDKERQREAWYNNYRFFGAPVGLLVFIDQQMQKGSWVDIGMFIDNVMLAARELGLETCPQASLAEYPNRVREQLDIDPQWLLVCGIALGYGDPQAPVNQYRLDREAVSAFTDWYD